MSLQGNGFPPIKSGSAPIKENLSGRCSVRDFLSERSEGRIISVKGILLFSESSFQRSVH